MCAGRVRTTRGATLRDSSSTKSCSASRSRRDRVALVALAALVLIWRDSADPPPSPTSAYGHLASVCCLCGVRAVGGTRPRVPRTPSQRSGRRPTLLDGGFFLREAKIPSHHSAEGRRGAMNMIDHEVVFDRAGGDAGNSSRRNCSAAASALAATGAGGNASLRAVDRGLERLATSERDRRNHAARTARLPTLASCPRRRPGLQRPVALGRAGGAGRGGGVAALVTPPRRWVGVRLRAARVAAAAAGAAAARRWRAERGGEGARRERRPRGRGRRAGRRRRRRAGRTSSAGACERRVGTTTPSFRPGIRSPRILTSRWPSGRAGSCRPSSASRRR